MAALLLASATGAARALLPAARAGRGGGTLFSSAAARGRAATVPVQRPFSFSYSAAVAKGGVDLLICDEAHRLKNAKGDTQTVAGLRALRCERRVLLSAGPIVYSSARIRSTAGSNV